MKQSTDTSQKVFIPITDEMLYDHPELITAPLRPYQIDNPCFHWMATIESPEFNTESHGQEKKPSRVVKRFDHSMTLDVLEQLLGRAVPQN